MALSVPSWRGRGVCPGRYSNSLPAGPAALNATEERRSVRGSDRARAKFATTESAVSWHATVAVAGNVGDAEGALGDSLEAGLSGLGAWGRAAGSGRREWAEGVSWVLELIPAVARRQLP